MKATAGDKTASSAICISHLVGLDRGVGEGYQPAEMEVCDGPYRRTFSHGRPSCPIAARKESAV
jgi:hypothetical protein